MNDSAPDLLPQLKNVEHVDAFSSEPARQQASTILTDTIVRLSEQIKASQANILVWKRQLLACKSQQNRLPGVAKLPNEILLHVWAYPAQEAQESPEQHRDWMAITQVCRSWRQLALRSPSLWRWPCIMLPESAWCLIGLAGGRPISLYIDLCIDVMISAENIKEIFLFATRFLHQAESLTLRVHNTMIPEDLEDCVDFVYALENGGPFRQLKCIDIEYGTMPVRGVARSELDVNALVRSAPNLARLNLTNKGLSPILGPLLLPQLPNLTHLEVDLYGTTYSGLPTDQEMPLHEILGALSSLSHLQCLTLVRAFRPLTDIDRRWSQQHPTPVAMSTLSTLYVSCDVQNLDFFLSHIHYPPTALVTVDIVPRHLPSGHTTLYTEYMRCLQHILQTITASRHPDGQIQYLEVEESELTDSSGVADHLYIGFSPHPNEQPMRIQVFWPQFRWVPLHHMPTMCRFEGLENLCYSLPSSEMDMWKAFGRLPSLKNIHVPQLEDHPTLLRVLSIFASSGESIFNVSPSDLSSSTYDELFFPNLYLISRSNSLAIGDEITRIMYGRGRLCIPEYRVGGKPLDGKQ